MYQLLTWMLQKRVIRYNVIRTEYADERISTKLEYIKRKFKSEQAYKHLESEISRVERELSQTALFHKPYTDDDNNEYRYAPVNVGEGYYLQYRIDGKTVIVDDCYHRRELRDII